MTTTPGTMLEELLRQHEVIRQLSVLCDELIQVVEVDASRVPELVLAVSRLRWAVTSHNSLEEQLLVPVLSETDSFGAERVARMAASHRAEHAGIGQRLEDPVIASLRQTLGLLRAHLEEEERTFLTSRVLRDDLVTVEGTG
jgi:iron-sulfur cluster repair protein YtfE (RIC family)